MFFNDFMRDDFAFLGRIAAAESLSSILFLPQTEHTLPLRQLLFYLQFQAFGSTAFGYYLVNMLLHLLTTGLVMRFAYCLFAQHMLAVLSGALFGVSAAHWITSSWISAQGQMLAGVWILLALLALLHWVQKRTAWSLLRFVLSCTVLPLSFSHGFELVLLTPMCIYVISTRSQNNNLPLASAWVYCSSSLAATLTLLIPYLISQYNPTATDNLLPTALELLANPRALIGIVKTALGAVLVHCAAAVTGVALLAEVSDMRRLYWVLCTLSILIAIASRIKYLPWHHSGKLGIVIFLLCATSLFFIGPSVVRPELSVYNRSWYAYIPHLFFSIATAAVFVELRERLPQVLTHVVVALVLLSNAYLVVTKNASIANSPWTAQHYVHGFVNSFAEKQKLNSTFAVQEHEFHFLSHRKGNWGVRLSWICTLYFSKDSCSQAQFQERFETPIPGISHYYRFSREKNSLEAISIDTHSTVPK